MTVGDQLPAMSAGEIDRDRIVAIMHVMRDPNPIHEDHAIAEKLGFRGLVNQGPANLSYAINMLMAWAGGPVAVRSLRFRFMDNVVPGDDVEASGTVTAVRDGEVDCSFELRSPGRLHLAGDATLAVADARA